jgi:hypothetical protein
VGVFVGVCVGVPVGVWVAALVAVFVGLFVAVTVGVCVGVAVGVPVGVSVGVSVAVSVGVSVGASAALHPTTVLLPAIDTRPALVVSALPVSVAFGPRETPACATTFPAKSPLRVAALVTCQNTSQTLAPLIRLTVEGKMAFSALPTWKM